jgi:hypothetical protein
LKITEGPVLRPFSYVKQSWDFFHFLEIVTGWLVPSASWSEDPSTAWLVPSTAEGPALAENRFLLQAGKGAENTKEKSRQCFTDEETLIRMKGWSPSS